MIKSARGGEESGSNDWRSSHFAFHSIPPPRSTLFFAASWIGFLRFCAVINCKKSLCSFLFSFVRQVYLSQEGSDPARASQVLGSEAAIWSEMNGAEALNIRQRPEKRTETICKILISFFFDRVWPRTAALAERLWTDPSGKFRFHQDGSFFQTLPPLLLFSRRLARRRDQVHPPAREDVAARGQVRWRPGKNILNSCFSNETSFPPPKLFSDVLVPPERGQVQVHPRDLLRREERRMVVATGILIS